MTHHTTPQKQESTKAAIAPSSNPLSPRPFAEPADAREAVPEPQLVDSSAAQLSIFASDGGSSPPLQRKLTIGAPNDPYEQEADRVAKQVVQHLHAPSPGLPPVQRASLSIAHTIHRTSNQTAVVGEASQELETSIHRARGRGHPLAPVLQQQMGHAMGADFSNVKVHTDNESDQLNRSIQAKAFTTGQDVFFQQGEYNPGSLRGQELIAHELTHVVQQQGAQLQKWSPRTVLANNQLNDPEPISSLAGHQGHHGGAGHGIRAAPGRISRTTHTLSLQHGRETGISTRVVARVVHSASGESAVQRDVSNTGVGWISTWVQEVEAIEAAAEAAKDATTLKAIQQFKFLKDGRYETQKDAEAEDKRARKFLENQGYIEKRGSLLERARHKVAKRLGLDEGSLRSSQLDAQDDQAKNKAMGPMRHARKGIDAVAAVANLGGAAAAGLTGPAAPLVSFAVSYAIGFVQEAAMAQVDAKLQDRARTRYMTVNGNNHSQMVEAATAVRDTDPAFQFQGRSHLPGEVGAEDVTEEVREQYSKLLPKTREEVVELITEQAKKVPELIIEKAEEEADGKAEAVLNAALRSDGDVLGAIMSGNPLNIALAVLMAGVSKGKTTLIGEAVSAAREIVIGDPSRNYTQLEELED